MVGRCVNTFDVFIFENVSDETLHIPLPTPQFVRTNCQNKLERFVLSRMLSFHPALLVQESKPIRQIYNFHRSFKTVPKGLNVFTFQS